MANEIYLEDYSSKWPEKFKEEQKILFDAIGDWIEDIEHIGSTAIPRLAAKPVIDIMIGVKTLKDADIYCISKIEALGYEYVQKYELEIPNRRYFRKDSSEGRRTHQIHLVEIHSDFWKNHLLFRDYLRSHPEVAKEYENLKKILAKQHCDVNEYAKAKTSFIRDVEVKAKRETH